MAIPTVTDYLKFANLQMAAEAFLVDSNGTPLTAGRYIEALKAGNNRSLLFTETQATAFADPDKGWTVLDQRANTTTGFSGTLFKNNQTGELVLSFRSSEFIDDFARDNKATNEFEIAQGGFALGQIADMEAWYAELLTKFDANGQPMLAGKTYAVTGYSLGAHLATVFNQLRQAELQSGPPAAALAEVITFNGAGVGQIDNGSLAGMVQRFQSLRNQAAGADGLLGLFQTDTGWTAYRDLRSAINANNGVVTSTMRDTAATAFGTNFLDKPLLKADSDLLLLAIDRALTVWQAANDAPNLNSGNAAIASPKAVLDDQILGENIDYQLAVLTTRREFDTKVRSIGAATAAVLFTGGLSKEPGTPALANQYDVVGWEYSAGNPVAVVAHSLWHHGADVRLFIEDQPQWRGGIGLASLSATLAAADVRLLVNGFSTKNFGDDHSLTLIVDSLNVQNTLLQLLPETQRGAATATLNDILRNASWRKGDNGDLAFGDSQGQAEGDVLENVVNALADLLLGPQTKANRLNGSSEGNTWWDTANQTVGDTTYSGRDRFYAQLKGITDSTIYKDKLANKLTLSPILGSTADLKEKAREDFGAFAALYSLSPFVLRMADGTALDVALQGAIPQENPWGAILADWKADKDKVLLGAERGTLNFSQEWYDDRAEFLVRKNWFNENNINPDNAAYQIKDDDHVYLKDSAYYKDFSSGYTIQQGVLHNNTRIYAFGDEQANQLAGNGVADHLFGGAGNDSLTGNYGDDLLDGGAGSDTLDGGAGFDRYRVGQTATDRDTIIDGDGKGLIKDANGRIVAGAFVAKEGGGYALIGNPDVTATKEGADLVVTLQGGSQQVVLANFNNTPGGELGVHLFDAPPTPETAPPDIKGDLQPIDGDLTTPDVVDLTFDGRGNVNVNATPAPGRDDTLFGSDGNDLIQAGGGNDTVSGKGGSDRIDAGDGDDRARAGSGNDIVIGGAGSDILRGEADADILHGGAEQTAAQAAITGETQLPTGLRGDLLDGGAGDDIAIGGAANDLLLGGTGNNTIYNAGFAYGGKARDGIRMKSRRWRHGELNSNPINDSTWRQAA